MTEYILQLSDEKATLDSVGGKGMSLARLARAGLPVPAGFHLTTAAYRKFVSANRQQAQIMDHLTNVNLSQPSSLEKASQHISQLFSSAAMPDEVAEEIKKSYEQLKGVPVAVRSSATAEDLPEASSAGQQDTYLNIQGEEALLAALDGCQ